jgi:heat shock protein HtpX
VFEGVVNAFVMFFSKVVAWAVASAMQGDEEESAPSMWVVWGLEMVCYMVFGLFGSLVVSWVSRKREFRADAGAARLSGAAKMCAALRRLKVAPQHAVAQGDDSFASLKISSTRTSWMELFSTHPPLDERIRRLGGSI